jgi:hypothetical protein
MAKFMQTLDDEIYEKLSKIAKERGLTVQELIRAVIIPFWLGYQEPEQITVKCPICRKWIPTKEYDEHLKKCMSEFLKEVKFMGIEKKE